MATRRSRRRTATNVVDNTEADEQNGEGESSSVTRTARQRYASANPGTWSELRKKIAEEIGISNLPSSLTRSQLLHIYDNNRPGANAGTSRSINSNNTPRPVSATVTTADIETNDSNSHVTSHGNNIPSHSGLSRSRPPTMQELLQTVNALQASVTAITRSFLPNNTNLPQVQSEVPTARHIMQSETVCNLVSQQASPHQSAISYGRDPNTLPKMEVVSLSLRTQIQEAYKIQNPCSTSPQMADEVSRLTTTPVSMNNTASYPLQTVKTELDKLWSAAVTVKTFKVYQSGYKAYLSFLITYCIAWSTIMPPISEEYLMLFVTHCSATLNLNFSTIK